MAPLLAIPPFPGARAPAFAVLGGAGNDNTPVLLGALARHRVGGCYWGRQIAGPAVLDTANWPADADPWSLLDSASEVRLPADDPRALLAVAAGKLVLPDDAVAALVQAHLTGWQWRDPFSGALISPLQTMELCGFWRQLIDSNRGITAVLGFAHWKRPTVAPLLWNGQDTLFKRGVPALAAADRVAVWRSRLSKAQTAALAGRPVLEV